MTRGFHFIDFSYKDAKYRIGAENPGIVTGEIVRLRSQLEAYIDIFPDFKDSLVPVKPVSNPPAIARSMFRAAELTGVGPLAAVAGAIAEFSARAAAAAGDRNVIVENGGDVFVISDQVRVISLFAGPVPLAQQLAFRISPDKCPVAICSSSATMGHSKSFGRADLVTVISKDAALADAAATALCNRVRVPGDIDPTLQAGAETPGIQGILIVLGNQVGMIGDLPGLVRNRDPRSSSKITRNCIGSIDFGEQQ